MCKQSMSGVVKMKPVGNELSTVSGIARIYLYLLHHAANGNTESFGAFFYYIHISGEGECIGFLGKTSRRNIIFMLIDEAMCRRSKYDLRPGIRVFQEVHQEVYGAAEGSRSFVLLCAYRRISVDIIVYAAENDDDIGIRRYVVRSAAEAQVMTRLLGRDALMR